MNQQQLEDWLKEINVKLVRLQQPKAHYLADYDAGEHFGRSVNILDDQFAWILTLTYWSDTKVELDVTELYIEADTRFDPGLSEFTSHADIIAHAKARGLNVYYTDHELTIFDLP